MGEVATRRHALLLLCGCLLALALPLVLLVDPRGIGLFVAVPPLLGYGLLELHRRYGRVLGTPGRVGSALVALCLVAWLFGTLLLATRPAGFMGVAAGTVLLGVGVAAVVPGSVLLAHDLRRHRIVSRPVAVLLGGALLLPVVPLAFTLLPLPWQLPVAASVGTGLVALELYWLAWTGVGVTLYRAAGTPSPERVRLRA